MAVGGERCEIGSHHRELEPSDHPLGIDLSSVERATKLPRPASRAARPSISYAGRQRDDNRRLTSRVEPSTSRRRRRFEQLRRHDRPVVENDSILGVDCLRVERHTELPRPHILEVRRDHDRVERHHHDVEPATKCARPQNEHVVGPSHDARRREETVRPPRESARRARDRPRRPWNARRPRCHRSRFPISALRRHCFHDRPHRRASRCPDDASGDDL